MMISIVRATKNDIASIVNIGSVSVTEAHKESCSAAILSEYINKNYNYDAIQKELEDEDNIYHIIHYDDKPVGFSKIVLNRELLIITSVVSFVSLYASIREFENLLFGFLSAYVYCIRIKEYLPLQSIEDLDERNEVVNELKSLCMKLNSSMPLIFFSSSL